MQSGIMVAGFAVMTLPATASELGQPYEFVGQSLQYQPCMGEAPGMSQARTCIAQEVQHQDARLSPEGRHHLQEAERAWIKWRDDQCRPAAGTRAAGAIDSLLCQIKETMSRTAEFKRD
ncbi:MULTISPECIES: lysozyme inhibitor LprI family protein [unclassified Xanthobacter]|uniref:lysozyme inhibitor LprI family protein n=1 Tax=unclassified Xanthobacter TaxID=2623496 RepID=UPI001F274997|nr:MULTISPECIES: lysozyme inhibitor LprI family protein [unclassified Xanthobacter]